MHRREMLQSFMAVAALPFLPRTGEAAVAFGEAIHARIALEPRYRTFSAGQRALVSGLADRILPATDTPGALDVRVPEFIDLLLTDWYDTTDRDRILAGLDAIAARIRGAGSPDFERLPDERKDALLQSLDAARDDGDEAARAFGQLKALTVYGYFTSERVAKDVLETQIVFAGYDGCAPFPR